MLARKVIEYTWNHPSNRKRRVRALADTFAWQIWKRVVRRPRTVSALDGMWVRCYPDSNAAGMLIYSGGWPAYDEMHFLRRYLRAGDNFVDVGTNIGVFTLLAGKYVGSNGCVLAIEGGRIAFDRLKENIALNSLQSVVEARNAAVGAREGTVHFLQNRDLTNRIAADTEECQEHREFEPIECVTLDGVLSGRTFALGKIDIEGAEPIAFQGGQRALRDANPPIWIMELKQRLLERFGMTPERVAEMLALYGYQLGIYDGNRNDLTFPEAPWHDHGDVFAIHRDHLDQVRARLQGQE